MKYKVALVTGASRGIGRAIAKRLAQDGFHLMITCIHREELLLDLKKEIENKYAVTCETFVGDMSDYDTVSALFHQIRLKLPGLSVIINNAGISFIGVLQDMSIEEWDRIIGTNLNSVFYCCKEGIPLLLRQGRGKIINISSVWGNVGASCEVAYSASKGGVNAFTKALAKELAPSNIQVNAIACGLIQTEMNCFLSHEEKDELISEIPAERMGQSEEVADLVSQLAMSPDYLTGQIITLDGGWI
ncbi:MAG TPA: SDR family NAD(P)-dependent oxidoreductase [Candidatus Merdenecus merdavium]|nr:SDR family NAD(P)-dependent oxidoreductase [Candidatus Merdenecus merdavium]